MRLIESRAGDKGIGGLTAVTEQVALSVNRAETLIRRLLDYCRTSETASIPVRVDRMISSMADLLRWSVGPSISLEIAVAEDLSPLHCCPIDLECALLNLAINAKDAMPDGGVVTIAAVLADHFSQVAGAAPEKMIALSVRDSGCGMSGEVAARALEPFFTTKAVGVGTGLGLAMVERFARAMNGFTVIDTVVGKGTSVTLYLPCVGAVAVNG